MKVCLVAPVSGWRGGIHQYSAYLANSLAEKVAVEVVGYKRIFPLWLYPGESKKLSGEIALRDDIAVHPVLKYYSLWSAIRATWLVRHGIRPDVVDVQWIAPQHGVVLIPLMWLVRHWAGTRVVLTVHNVLPHEPRLLDRLLSRWAFRLPHRLLVHAQAMKEELTASFGEDPGRISVIPHGICAESEIADSPRRARERLGIRQSQVVLFFGFVRPYKGLEPLIEAFAALGDRFDVALVIAGEWFSGLDECRRTIQGAGLGGRTYLFPRYIPYGEISLYFSAADIVVQPYVRFAGQSGVTQTAYLHALPVVATAVGGLPELVLHERTGLIVEPGNARALAEALRVLLADPDKRREYGAAGRRLLETQLAWGKIADTLMEIYAAA